jgi:hypothetical protein
MLKKPPLKEIIRQVYNGIGVSCALFKKYGNDIYMFNSQYSLMKDWNMVGDDIIISMKKFKRDYNENTKPKA